MASVYTKTGDAGETSLYGGTRISKCSERVNAYGAVDEVNAVLGIVKNSAIDPVYKDLIDWIQEKLFVIGGELASDEHGLKQLTQKIGEQDVAFLEKVIDEIARQLSPNQQFIKPGETMASGLLHFARTVVRRAEREVISSCNRQEMNPCIVQYLNRLSDCLFTLSKVPVKNGIVEKESWEMTLVLAEEMARRCKRASKEVGVPVVIAIVDEAGQLIHFSRMEEALLGSIDIAINKAYTAVAFKTPTHELSKLTEPSAPLYGLQQTNGGRVVVFGGGYPLVKGGRMIGGIGISGGSVEQDQKIAQAGLKLLEE